MNNFVKVCRKPKNSKPQNPKKRTLNTVDKETHPEDSVNFFQSSSCTNSTTAAGRKYGRSHLKRENIQIEKRTSKHAG